MRTESCNFVNSKNFFGVAVGGCLGTSTEEMHETVNYTMERLKKNRPVHLLGIGYLKDVFNAVENGVDTLDCVHPTRIARHYSAFVKYDLKQTEKENRTNTIILNKTKFENDDTSISKNCKCTTCRKNVRSYLHLLIKSDEKICQTLVTNHNVYFMNELMKDIRWGIETGNLEKVKTNYLG